MSETSHQIRQMLRILRSGHALSRVVIQSARETRPLIQEALSQADVCTTVLTDAQDAAYTALGQSLQSGSACLLVVCLKGGLMEAMGALEEAAALEAPLLVVAAAMESHPSECPRIPFIRYQEHLVRPALGQAEEDAAFSLAVNRAMLETWHRGKGVSLLTMDLERPSPLRGRDVTDPSTLAPVMGRVITLHRGLDRYNGDVDTLAEALNRLRRRMVIIGGMNYIYMFSKRAERLLDRQFTWVTEHASNHTAPTREPIWRMDEILYPLSLNQLEDLRPDLVITIGSVSLSRKLRYFLMRHPPLEHWHVSQDGALRDDFQGALRRAVEMDPFEFMERIAEFLTDIPSTYPGRWKQLQAALPVPSTLGMTFPEAIGRTLERMPQEATLHLVGGTVQQEAQRFVLRSGTQVLGGTALREGGGSLRACLAYASVSDRINFILTSDMSFFQAARQQERPLSQNLRILLLNDGGDLASALLPAVQDAFEDGAQRGQSPYAGHRHADDWCRQTGTEYLSAASQQELDCALEVLCDPQRRLHPVLLEVTLNLEEDVRAIRERLKALKEKR